MPNFELQNLVHSLDKGELSRFKEYCDEEAHYARLFYALKDFALAEEEDFRQSHGGMPFMDNYSYNKGYLLDKVMDAMRSQRKRGGLEKLIHQQVAEWMADAEFLQERIMPELCLKRIQKAEKEARHHELHEDLIRILRFRCRLLLAEQAKGYEQVVLALCDEMHGLSRIIENRQVMHNLRVRLFMLSRIAPEARNEQRRRELEEVTNDPHLSDPQNALSFEAKLNFWFCQAILAQLRGDVQRMQEHHQRVYDLWKAAPQFQQSRPVDYRSSLNNYLIVCCATETFTHFTEAVTRMEAPPFRSDDERLETRHNSWYVRLHYFMVMHRWDDAAAIQTGFESKYHTIAQKMIPSRTVAFYQSFARLNLILGKLPKAVDWNEKVIAMRSDHVRRDLVRHALLFSLVLYFELGDIGKLENRYRVVMRELSREELVLKFERQILQLLRRLPKIADEKELRQQFALLLTKMDSLANDLQERQAQGFDFLRTWLRAKVEKQPLMRLLNRDRS